MRAVFSERPPVAAASASRVAGRQPWWVLAVLIVALLVIGVDAMILYVALPTLSAQLGATNTDLQWIIDGYVLVLAGLLLPFGVVGDRFGRKRVLLIGLLLFGVASALSAWADSPGELIAYRALMGLGAAIVFPVSLAILPAVFGPEQRSRAVAVWAAGVAAGVPLGPVVGGWLLAHFWWGSVFLINVPLMALAVLAATVLVPETRDPAAPRVDVSGALLSTAGLCALVYGIIRAPDVGWTDPLALAAVAAGVVMLVLFTLWQRRTGTPLVDLRLFADRRFALATVAFTIATFILVGLLLAVTQYLQVVAGNSALGTGLRLLPLIGGLIVGAGAGQRLAARRGPRLVLTVGLAVEAGAALSLLRVGLDTGYPLLGWTFVLLGAGLGMAIGTGTDQVMAALPADAAGAGAALSQTVRQVATALGVAVLGSILNTVYTDRVAQATTALPAPAAHTAQQSLAGAAAVAARLGPAGHDLAHAAHRAFVDGMHTTLATSAIIGLAAACVVAVWYPCRPHAHPTPHDAGETSTTDN